MQIGYISGLGADPVPYACLAFPNTPGCPPKTTPTTTTPTTTPATAAAVSASMTDYWNKIPTWVKILGGAAVAYFGYKKFVAKK